jgi:hypothetical protein
VDGAALAAEISWTILRVRQNSSPPISEFTLSAWVDESVIVGGPTHPGGTYTLAAVVTETAAAGGIRDVLRELPLTRGGRLHWVDESWNGCSTSWD